jgi:hypothetical protein
MAEVQDIFAASFADYSRTHFVSTIAQKAAQAIISCRTAALGGHVDSCPDCGYERNSYNSCRNRHCPKCQTLKKEQWIGKRCEDILDIRHFHIVFTIPAELYRIVMQNPVTLYGLLFKSTADTIKELAADPKHLGAVPGFTSILHTWGQNLLFHPHIHMVATGGGLSSDGKWKYSSKKFFLPVKVLSKLFRGKFLAALQQFYDNGVISYRNTNGSAATSQTFAQLVSACYKKAWCVYCKKPFKNTGAVFSYLGRYTHRVAISNNRIIQVEQGNTRLRWRDYADGSKVKEMELTNIEFIRRFLLHVLPHGFTRIRHYGLYASKNKTTKLATCRKVIGSSQKYKKLEESPLTIISRILGRDVRRCPQCGRLLTQHELARASPA